MMSSSPSKGLRTGLLKQTLQRIHWTKPVILPNLYDCTRNKECAGSVARIVQLVRSFVTKAEHLWWSMFLIKPFDFNDWYVLLNEIFFNQNYNMLSIIRDIGHTTDTAQSRDCLLLVRINILRFQPAGQSRLHFPVKNISLFFERTRLWFAGFGSLNYLRNMLWSVIAGYELKTLELHSGRDIHIMLPSSLAAYWVHLNSVPGVPYDCRRGWSVGYRAPGPYAIAIVPRAGHQRNTLARLHFDTTSLDWGWARLRS